LALSPRARKDLWALIEPTSAARAKHLQGYHPMKLSARNQIAGTIKTVKPGATTTHVTIEVSPTVMITASITNEAAEELALKPGIKAVAVIKASDVMVGI
jgi:molybdopterin-binding protein